MVVFGCWVEMSPPLDIFKKFQSVVEGESEGEGEGEGESESESEGEDEVEERELEKVD